LSKFRFAIRLLVTTEAKMERIVACLKEWAPYLALELVMPGGTMMALLLYLHRRRAAILDHLRQQHFRHIKNH
jgi:hypothetical protein